MPNLPTITVTQVQADKIISAFGADQATAIENYKNWLTNQVREFVLRTAVAEQIDINNAAVQTAREETEAALPPEAEAVEPIV